MINIDVYFDFLKHSLPGKLFLSALTGMVGSAILVVFFFPILTTGGLLSMLPWIVGFNSALTGYTLMDKAGADLKFRRLSTAAAGVLCAITAWGVAATAALRTEGVFLVPVADLAILIPVGLTAGWLGGVLAIKYFGLDLGRSSN